MRRSSVEKELEGLPFNGRQFANLASLAPGTQLSVNADPTKPGQLTIALNGGSGRNVNFVIDGGDNTDDTIGGALQNYNLEAVQEFKIQTMQYKAEYGRSSGGVLTVVTKTGTNQFLGSAYEFFRDKSLNSEDTSETNAGNGKNPYRRNQFGLSFGGPIIKDKAHFFITGEQTQRKTEYVVDTGGIYPAFDGQAVSIPFKDTLVTAKASINLTPTQFLQVRYGYQKNTDVYGATPAYLPSANGVVANKYRSLLGGHSWQLGSDMLNEFIYQWTRFENGITADSNDPFLYFPSGVVSGQNINTPQTTIQEKSQFKDDLSWSKTLMGSRHDFKAGVNYVHEPILGGSFSTGETGQFNMLENDPNGPVKEITVFGGFNGDQTPMEEYSAFGQDDWTINPKLVVNLGLRYDYWDGFDLNQTSNVAWQTMSQSTLDFPWLKPLEGGKGGQLKNDHNNIAPRLGFTYDMKGDGKTLVRGGIGRYYDFPYTNATILFPSAAVQSDYGVVYDLEDPNGIRNADGSFFHPGQTLPSGGAIGSGGIPVPREVASPNIATPYSDQASLGYSFELNNAVGFNFEAVGIRYRDIPYRFRANPMIDTNGDGIPDQLAFPGLSASTRLWVGDGSAKYNGVNLGFHARIAAKLEAQGFYTYSKATGNVLVGADEFRLWDGSLETGPVRDTSVDPADPQCSACFGPLDTDARNRLTFGAIYNAPFGINVSGIFRYRSALPYTELAGADLNGDGYFNDLAPGVSNVNNLRGHSFEQFDVRLSKEFRMGNGYGVELIAEAFNVFNARNQADYNGNILSSNFGEPGLFAGDPGQGEQRLIQLGARVRF